MKESEWWWIDYLEDMLDPSLDQNLQLLLEHSQEDRDLFEVFRLLRQWLKESDPVAGWPIDERLARLRTNVMSALENENLEDYWPLSEDTKSLSV